MGCTGSKATQASKPQETQAGATLLTDPASKPEEQKPTTEPAPVVPPAEASAATEQPASADTQTPEAGEKALEAAEAAADAPAAVELTAEAPAAAPTPVEEVAEPVLTEAKKTEEAAPANDCPEAAEQTALQAVTDDMVEEAADANMAKEPVDEPVLTAPEILKQEALVATAKSGFASFGACCSYCAADDKAAELAVVQKQN